MEALVRCAMNILFVLWLFISSALENSSFGYHEWKIVLYWRSVEILSTKTPGHLSIIVSIWELTFMNENIFWDVILFYPLITNILLIYGNSSCPSTFFELSWLLISLRVFVLHRSLSPAFALTLEQSPLCTFWGQLDINLQRKKWQTFWSLWTLFRKNKTDVHNGVEKRVFFFIFLSKGLANFGLLKDSAVCFS